MMLRSSNTRPLVLPLLLLVLTVVPTSFGHIGYSEKELKHALRKLQPEKLHALLVASGYTKASLGDKLPGMTMKPNLDTDALKTGVTFPTECGTVYMHDFPGMQVLNRTNPAFMEIRERVSLYKSAKKTAGQTTERIHDAKENVDLACECDSYFCSCRKQCFCQLKAEPFDGRTVIPGANSRNKPALPDHQFKCTCAFDGVGGQGFINGGTMDCDCKIADCACEKQCKCSPAKEINVRRPYRPGIRYQEKGAGLLTNNDANEFARMSSLHG